MIIKFIDVKKEQAPSATLKEKKVKVKETLSCDTKVKEGKKNA